MKKVFSTLILSILLLIPVQGVLASGGELLPVYRVYNPSSGEHLYTPEMVEVDNLQAHGWIFEGEAWNAVHYQDSGVAVYRLYCHVTGKHLYTIDSSEVATLVDTGIWTLDFDGNPIFGAISPDSFTVKAPIYRLYNASSQTHLLTKDENEYTQLPAQGWTQEGIAFYEYLY